MATDRIVPRRPFVWSPRSTDRIGADARRPPTRRPRLGARHVSTSPMRVVSRRPASVRTERPRSPRHRAENRSPGSSVDQNRGRRTRSSSRPTSRGAMSPALRWWSATDAVARRCRSSAVAGLTAPTSAMRPATARLASRSTQLACRRAVRRTSRAASRVVPGRLRRVVVGDEPAHRAGRPSRLGHRVHRRDGAALEPYRDLRVSGTRLLPPHHRPDHAHPPRSAPVLVPRASPLVALARSRWWQVMTG